MFRYSLARRFAASQWASINPKEISAAKPGKLQNYVNGKWHTPKEYIDVISPLNGEKILECPDTQSEADLKLFSDSLKSCPKSGLHNPLKNPHRYADYGELSFKIAEECRKPDVEQYFVDLMQKVIPKSDEQARGEFIVTRKFFENWAGDAPRIFLKGFVVPGDVTGQQTTGYRFPFGPCMHIAPFNFPIEINALHLFGGLMAGNKVLAKIDSRVSVVFEQFLRMMLHLGLPEKDVDLIHCDGPNAEKLIRMTPEIRNIQFVGSSKVADHLATITKGKVRLEDAGFDWKILAPDVSDVDYVAWQSDQDAFACSGQKCSAQSIVFAHENWIKAGFNDKVKALAERRNLGDRTCIPIFTWTNKQIQAHVDECLKIPGAKLLFGGKPLSGHSIPECYGAYEPTSIYVPLDKIADPKYFKTVTKELFGPFYITTSYSSEKELDTILNLIDNFDNHLTAGVVSKDSVFINKVLGNTINGVTYSGIKARTTGAPQNHWFGPSGDPRAAGIGTPEAVLCTWTGHREVISDIGPLPADWKTPEAS